MLRAVRAGVKKRCTRNSECPIERELRVLPIARSEVVNELSNLPAVYRHTVSCDCDALQQCWEACPSVSDDLLGGDKFIVRPGDAGCVSQRDEVALQYHWEASFHMPAR